MNLSAKYYFKYLFKLAESILTYLVILCYIPWIITKKINLIIMSHWQQWKTWTELRFVTEKHTLSKKTTLNLSPPLDTQLTMIPFFISLSETLILKKWAVCLSTTPLTISPNFKVVTLGISKPGTSVTPLKDGLISEGVFALVPSSKNQSNFFHSIFYSSN